MKKRIFIGVLLCSALSITSATAKVTYEKALTDEATATAESKSQYQARLNDPNNYRPLDPAIGSSGSSIEKHFGRWVANGQKFMFRTGQGAGYTVRSSEYMGYAQLSQLTYSLPPICIRGDKIGLYSHVHHYDTIFNVYECR